MSEYLHSELPINHQETTGINTDNTAMPSTSVISFLLNYSKSVEVKSSSITSDLVVHLN